MWAQTAFARTASIVRPRSLHTSVRRLADDISKDMERVLTQDTMPLNKLPSYRYDDISTIGHLRLQKERQMLKYYRLVANEFPKLKELSEPFTPPPASSFLTFKFTHYQGEAHPDTRKVVLTFAVKDMFGSDALPTPLARHKFLLLAGPRWKPPTPEFVTQWNDALQAGPDALEALWKNTDDLGSVKIASQNMPHEAQNMKWCSDVLDRMVSEAIVRPYYLHTDRADVCRCAARRASLHRIQCAWWTDHTHDQGRLPERMASIAMQPMQSTIP